MRAIVAGKCFAVAMSIALVLLPAGLYAEEPDRAPTSAEQGGVFTSDEIIGGLALPFDLMVLRPLGVVATVLGFALFLPAAALSLVDYPDTTEEAWDIFVLTPAKSVYERPLGDL